MKSSCSSSSFDEIRLKENLFKAGFDICHGPFSPKLYNDRIEEDGLIASGTLFPLPETITDPDDSNNNDDDDNKSGLLLGGSSTNKTKKQEQKQKKTKAYLIVIENLPATINQFSSINYDERSNSRPQHDDYRS